MEQAQFKLVGMEEHADIIIVNTCTVTNTADSKSLKMIHKAKRENSIVVAVGCMAQNKKEIEDVDILLGNVGKSQIAQIILEYVQNRQAIQQIQDVMNPTNWTKKARM